MYGGSDHCSCLHHLLSLRVEPACCGRQRDSGVYVKVRMELDPAKVDELVNRYHLVEEVFRVQILAVDERREAKIAAERAARAERQAKKDAAAAAAAAPVAEEA